MIKISDTHFAVDSRHINLKSKAKFTQFRYDGFENKLWLIGKRGAKDREIDVSQLEGLLDKASIISTTLTLVYEDNSWSCGDMLITPKFVNDVKDIIVGDKP